MLKLLYTGASGFLGSNTIPRLTNLNYSINTIGPERSDYICDLSTTVPQLDQTFEVVLHAAGKAHSVPKTEDERRLFFNVNLQGTKNICEALERYGLPKMFIFISTVAVYGVDAGEGITEQHPLNGETPYAKSKILAEKFLNEWAQKHNVILTILRLPLVAGINPPGNLGDMIKGIRSGRYLSIGKANARKSVIWAEDVADIVAKIASIGGTYNITDGYNPSFGELELEISRAFNKKPPVSIPLFAAKAIGMIGDLLGKRAPINSNKLTKITSSLTFNDKKLHGVIKWTPSPVIQKLSQSLS
jgi:nucleoside-diphosphate-sugar epimerase